MLDAATDTELSCEPAPALDEALERIQGTFRSLQDLQRKCLEHARELGELLISVKDQLDHGQFHGWIKRKCPFSPRRATDYMTIAREWPLLEELATANRQAPADLTILKAIKMLGDYRKARASLDRMPVDEDDLIAAEDEYLDSLAAADEGTDEYGQPNVLGSFATPLDVSVATPLDVSVASQEKPEEECPPGDESEHVPRDGLVAEPTPNHLEANDDTQSDLFRDGHVSEPTSTNLIEGDEPEPRYTADEMKARLKRPEFAKRMTGVFSDTLATWDFSFEDGADKKLAQALLERFIEMSADELKSM